MSSQVRKPWVRTALLGVPLAAGLVLTGCYASDVDAILNGIAPPTVAVGNDQLVQPNVEVTLVGQVSGAERFEWAQVVTSTSVPVVALSNPFIEGPTFTAPANPSTLDFRLCAFFKRRQTCAETTVQVQANQLPVAAAGDDRIVRTSTTVQLDGSASQDPDGANLAGYEWTVTPTIALAGFDATAERPTFTSPDTGTTLQFTLRVRDVRGGLSDPDTVTIEVNAPPVVSVTYPPNGALLGRRAGQLSTRITGIVTDGDAQDTLTVSVQAGDNPAVVDSDIDADGRWAVSIEIPDGRSIPLTISAQDSRAGQAQGTPTSRPWTVNNEVLIVLPKGLAVDETDGTAYFLNQPQDIVVRVDPALTPVPGARTIVSPPSANNDTRFDFGQSADLRKAVLDSANNCLLVLTSSIGFGRLVAVDLNAGGARSVVTSNAVFADTQSEPGFLALTDMVLDTTGANGPRLLLSRFNWPSITTGAVLAMDLNHQAGCQYQPSRPAILYPTGDGAARIRVPRKLGLSAAADKLFLFDLGVPPILPASVLEFDLATADRRVIATDTNNATPPFVERDGGLVVDDAQDRLFLTDTGVPTLVEVRLSDGRIQTSALTGTAEQPWSGPADLARGPNGRLFVLDARALFTIDPSNNDATAVYSESLLGTGPPLRDPTGIAVNLDDTSPRIFVIDAAIPAIVEIDPTTGDRSILRDPTNTPPIVQPRDLVLSEDGTRLFYVDADATARSLVQVDIREGANRGNRTVVSAAGVGLGPEFSQPRAVSLVSASQALVLDDGTITAIYEVDLEVGTRRLIASNSQGTGGAFVDPKDLLVTRGGQLVVLEPAFLAGGTTGWLYTLDTASGDRTVFSGTGPGPTPVGTGASFDFDLRSSVESVFNTALQREELLVTNANGDLIAVALDGSRTSLISGGLSGPPFLAGASLAIDQASQHSYSALQDYRGVFLVDLRSGQRVLVSR